jgi:hypothetical protein
MYPKMVASDKKAVFINPQNLSSSCNGAFVVDLYAIQRTELLKLSRDAIALSLNLWLKLFLNHIVGVLNHILTEC